MNVQSVYLYDMLHMTAYLYLQRENAHVLSLQGNRTWMKGDDGHTFCLINDPLPPTLSQKP